MKEMNDAEKNLLKAKAEFYKKEKCITFLKTKLNLKYNGHVQDVFDNHIIFSDRFTGRMYISFTEIEKIEPWANKGKVNP